MMNLISNVVFATVSMLHWTNMKNILLILPQHHPPLAQLVPTDIVSQII